MNNMLRPRAKNRKKTEMTLLLLCLVLYTAISAETVIEKYPSGKLKIRAEEVGEHLHGKWTTWYENGNLRDQGVYSNGKRTGRWKMWYESGVLAQSQKYENDLEIDTSLLYHENGSLQMMTVYSDDRNRITRTVWHPNGIKGARFTEVNSEIDGVWETWHPNGTVKSRSFYIAGDKVDSLAYVKKRNAKTKPGVVRARESRSTRVIYRTKGHHKAKGIDITFEVPKDWLQEEGKRPNIVKVFSTKIDGISVSCVISVKDAELPKQYQALVTEKGLFEYLEFEDIKEMIPENSTFVEGKKTLFDGQPGAWLYYITKSEHAGVYVIMHTLNNMFTYKDKIVGIQFMVGTGKVLDPEGQQSLAFFKKMIPEFLLIANSCVLNNKWQ